MNRSVARATRHNTLMRVFASTTTTTRPYIMTSSNLFHTTTTTTSSAPPPPKKLLYNEIKDDIPSEWTYNADKEAIERQFIFQDFKQAFSFMSTVAEEAESMNHHPEWFNVYNRLHVLLRTHDCNGISINDLNMAQYMNQLFTMVDKQQQQLNQHGMIQIINNKNNNKNNCSRSCF